MKQGWQPCLTGCESVESIPDTTSNKKKYSRTQNGVYCFEHIDLVDTSVFERNLNSQMFSLRKTKNSANLIWSAILQASCNDG